MTKADIINKIAMNTGLQKKDVAVVVESFMESIKSSLLEDKEANKKNCTYNLISVNQVSQEQNIITHNNHFNKLKLCQTERKKRDTRWLRTSVKKD